jgi:hypothetical protein
MNIVLNNNDTERELHWMVKWIKIIGDNSYDFYFDTLNKKYKKKLLFTSIHAIGLIFPIALVVNGKILVEKDIEPSQQAFDIFFTNAMSGKRIVTIPVFDGNKFIDAYYTTSINKLKQVFKQQLN